MTETKPGIGHNGGPPLADDALKTIVEAIERLGLEKKAIGDDMRDMFAEAKGKNFDVKALRTVIRKRAQKDREEQDEIVDAYMRALGM